MKETALLVVDVQRAVWVQDLAQKEQVTGNICRLVSMAREKEIPVIFVRHDDGPGSELTQGTEGWELIPQLSPQPGEPIVDKKYNSAFYQTGLEALLKEKGIRRLVLVGAQTELCVDATCKGAFERGLQVVIPASTHTTANNGMLSGEELVRLFTYKIWKNRYASIPTVEELCAEWDQE